jgi:type 1 glutamine amidotransferase
MRNLLLTGGHGHDFDAIAAELVALLDEVDVETTTVTDPRVAIGLLQREGPDAFDLLTVHALRWRMAERPVEPDRATHAFALAPKEAQAIDAFVRAGGGLLALHAAVICFDADPTWRDLCGAAWAWDRSTHPPHGEVRIAVTDAGRAHPLTSGLDDVVLVDEVYGFLDEVEGLEALLASRHGGRDHPVCWARSRGRGRVVTDVLGHDATSFAHPAHRRLVQRAAAWAGGRELERPLEGGLEHRPDEEVRAR